MSDRRADHVFAVADACGLLQAAGLLAGVLVPGPDGLQRRAGSAGPAASDGFCGARLDSRLLQGGELFAALPGEHVHGRQFAPAWLDRGGWVLTDAPDGDEPLLGATAAAGGGVLLCRDPQAALGVLGAAWRTRQAAVVVGVTGTNGKTTTKDFLAALLSGAGPTHATTGNFNNFLGVPVTLLGLRPAHRFAVIEMGASAVGEIDHLAGLARPAVGLITNASPAHLAEFGSLAGIIQGKGELLDHLPADGTAVLNADSPGWDEWRRRAPCRVVSLGRMRGDHHWLVATDAHGPTLRLDNTDWPLPLPGEHNGCNLAAAILAGRAAGATDAELRSGLAAFRGSPHRGVVLQVAGLTVVDDAYNANPASILAACRTVVAMAGGGRTLAVLGHMAELGPDSAAIHAETGRQLAATGLATLVCVGPEARGLGEGFDAMGGSGHYCADVGAAAAWLSAHAGPGDHVLIKGSRSAAMERILPLLAANGHDDHRNRD
jgi:UDP-N-acetylmuramoyl-tripeptide--D-alanyl-D-alanine ligase